MKKTKYLLWIILAGGAIYLLVRLVKDTPGDHPVKQALGKIRSPNKANQTPEKPGYRPGAIKRN